MKATSALLLAPAAVSAALCRTNHTATFDDLQANSATPYYNAITWPGFHTSAVSSGGLFGGSSALKAHSAPNVLTFSPTDLMSFASPGINMYFSGSGLAKFSLQSLYLACINSVAAPPLSNAWQPAQCEVQVQGTAADALNGYRQKNLTFGGGQTMTQFNFTGPNEEDWSQLSDITMMVLNSAVGSPTVVIDDVVFSTWEYC